RPSVTTQAWDYDLPRCRSIAEGCTNAISGAIECGSTHFYRQLLAHIIRRMTTWRRSGTAGHFCRFKIIMEPIILVLPHPLGSRAADLVALWSSSKVGSHVGLSI